MDYTIDHCESLSITDDEISDLLAQVYVQAGFTSADRAKSIFDPAKVKSRGILFAARQNANNEFIGMVIVVPAHSSAAVLAKENECEMHLLAVKPGYREHGLGRSLVNKAIEFAKQNNWSKMILWTQKPMQQAQSLYEASGFVRVSEMTKDGIEFMVYERNCE